MYSNMCFFNFTDENNKKWSENELLYEIYFRVDVFGRYYHDDRIRNNCMANKVKTQYAHCRSITSYFVFPWRNPEN